MKILIRTLIILAITIAFLKPTSAMESSNINNYSEQSDSQNSTPTAIKTAVKKFYGFCKVIREQRLDLFKENKDLLKKFAQFSNDKQHLLFEQSPFGDSIVKILNSDEQIENAKQSIKEKILNLEKTDVVACNNLIAELKQKTEILSKRLVNLEYIIQVCQLKKHLEKNDFENFNNKHPIYKLIKEEYDFILTRINRKLKYMEEKNKKLLNNLNNLNEETRKDYEKIFFIELTKKVNIDDNPTIFYKNLIKNALSNIKTFKYKFIELITDYNIKDELITDYNVKDEHDN